ncbi:hypothetical protein TrLO_g15186 [Triparma laevis f. longispina]|uniref:Fe2OG dioxygenase domain-containing protein n=1 Tax=Triparma laevis f. longispina TaxID=1714387 RepID=A0A9W7FNZ6_9STRA|nr:hypothetical protein TrLO_g15186 [Triparma laevis f. longispina]
MSSSSDPPPSKRPKTTLPTLPPIFSRKLSTSIECLAQEYSIAEPFAHGQIESFLSNNNCNTILKELKGNLKATFKESDLFKFYQTIDVGNLNPETNPDQADLCSKMPTLMSLKSSLYSPQFRSTIETLCSLPPNTLTSKIDCAVNLHTTGCHLLCHDDVIGTRKISYIIYLTDESPEWKAEDGGLLEIYSGTVEADGTRIPSATPIKTIIPKHNSIAFFEVKPNHSFHSVQEVFADRPRMSIQGWYHAALPPSDIESATLQRLKTENVSKGEDTEGSYSNFSAGGISRRCFKGLESFRLEEGDREILGEFINGTYLEEGSLEMIRERFEQDSSIQLRDFLLPKYSDRIKELISKHDDEDNLGVGKSSANKYNAGENRSGWNVIGPAHKQRMLGYSSGDDELGQLLDKIKTFQTTDAYARFLLCCTSLDELVGYRGKVRRFRPGLDYTVAHYGIFTTKSVLDGTLVFVPGDGKQVTYDEDTGDLLGSGFDEQWSSGEVGGFECYIAADEDEGAERRNDEVRQVRREPSTGEQVRY